MGYNKDLFTPLLFSTDYTTSHTLAQYCNINDDQNITETSSVELKEREKYKQSRWNPTPEQMMVLEEVYSSGTRTPTTQQIQEIASKLQKYGRIEGKNVFYWFQNHKSRERLKRRRRPDHHQQGLAIHNVHEAPLGKDNKDSSSSVPRKRGDHRVIHTRTCLSSPPTHPRNNNIDDGKRGLVEEKEAICQNPINTSDFNYISCKRSQDSAQQDNQEEEETRKSRTLNLFPVTENQDKTGFAVKNTKPNQLCYYYYEFMPLMN